MFTKDNRYQVVVVVGDNQKEDILAVEDFEEILQDSYKQLKKIWFKQNSLD